MVFWVPLIAYALVLLFTAGVLARAPRPLPPHSVATALMRGIFLFPAGLMGLWGALGHTVFAAQAAASIGWAPSPFQFEVAMANLAIGVTGIVATFYPNWGFRFATALAAACFLGGAAVGHLVQISTTGNLAAGNAGPILYTDILTPLALLVLLAVTRRTARG